MQRTTVARTSPDCELASRTPGDGRNLHPLPTSRKYAPSHSGGVPAELPDSAEHEYSHPHGQVQHPEPLEVAADQWVVHEFVEPVQRCELRQGGVGVREMADRNEEAAGKAAQHQDERDDLRDVLRGKQVADEQSEGGEQEGSDPHADPGDDPQIRSASTPGWWRRRPGKRHPRLPQPGSVMSAS